MGEFAIGQGVPRFEDPRLLRGAANMSTISCSRNGVRTRAALAACYAKIKSIDITAAKAAPGVLVVLPATTGFKSGWGRPAGAGHPQAPRRLAKYKPRYPALVKDIVRFVGDYVASSWRKTRTKRWMPAS